MGYGASTPYCANTTTDNDNCGACGVVCASGKSCTGGKCELACGALATCTPDGGAAYCANTKADNDNCGACGTKCPSGQVCSGGSCSQTCGSLTTCTPDGGTPYGANTKTDDDNCGACGTTCPSGQSCTDSKCALTCGSLTTCAPDGGTPYCANTKTDNDNCGACGTTCTVPATCISGSCAAPVTTCAALQAASGGGLPDGTYTLYAEGNWNRPVPIWCADMATTPAEYLTLPNQTNANYSNDHSILVTQFQRVRIDLTLMIINPNDLTFSTSTGSDGSVTAIDYATAYSCDGNEDGTANVDLTGTHFAVAQNQFGAGGTSGGWTTTSHTNQTVSLGGGGNCGWLAPSGSYNPYNGSGATPLHVVYYAQ
jgi:hypothetical protein